MGAIEGLHRLTADEAIALTADALIGYGSPPSGARLQAAHLVEAELRGHPSHGLRRLSVLLARIHAGLIDTQTEPTFDWTGSGALRVDGCRGLGPVVAYATIDEMLSKIAPSGVVVGALRGTHHLGMLAPYVERIAQRGYIGIVISSTEGLVHPWGGSGALVGTNPLAIGVPADGDCVTLDMSTASVSAGKILDHLERGMSLPEGWAVDAAGRPTQDPGEAIVGAISPFGGAKGYALGLALGAVVGVLTGTEFGPGVVGTLDSQHETTKGDVIIAVDIEAFGQNSRSRALSQYLQDVRESGIDGGSVSIPGDRSRAHRARSLEEGFDVTDEVWQLLMAIRDTADVSGTRL
ncbi:Ldh family oxidoreductase [Microbacterium sp. P02]|uniref:Ldh family oxidoreductase n=1 Tax=Microbacterium sp. P02 TaxID=3366260 RepID=UPI00366BCCAB